MLAVTAWLFDHGMLTATTQTIAWVVIFFFASAGASAAYLTVSEIFPMETRALAIAFFYAVGTGLGGIIGPVLFGNLIATKHPSTWPSATSSAAGLMVAAGIVEVVLGVDAEQKSLEDVATPVSAVDGDDDDRDATTSTSPPPRTRGAFRAPPHPGGRTSWSLLPAVVGPPEQRSLPRARARCDRAVARHPRAAGTARAATIRRRAVLGAGALPRRVRHGLLSGRVRRIGGHRLASVRSDEQRSLAAHAVQ